MQDFPKSILEYVHTCVLNEKSPAYFLMDTEGKVIRSGGMLHAFSIDTPRTGDNISDILLFMEGMLPLEQSSLKLSRVRIHPHVTIDAHLFHTAEGYGLLLLDAAKQETLVARFQQKANELVLLREENSRIIEQGMGKDFSDQLLMLDPHTRTKTMPAAIFFAGIRGIGELAERHDPLEIFPTLRDYLSALTQPVHVEGGIVKDIFGNTVTAVFGLLPSTLSPSRQCLHAVNRIFENVASLNKKMREFRRNALDVGIGVASSQIMIGLFGTKKHHSLMILGPCVKKADLLEKSARSGQVLVDRVTFESSAEFKTFFVPDQVRPEDNSKSFEAFSWEGLND